MQIYHYFSVVVLAFVTIGCICNVNNILLFSYGQEQRPREMIITIPKGSANYEVDITNLSPRQWYDSRDISINMNDTIKWINNDTEQQTITSSLGGGLNSLLTNSALFT